jgi:chromosome segregation ATPase
MGQALAQVPQMQQQLQQATEYVQQLEQQLAAAQQQAQQATHVAQKGELATAGKDREIASKETLTREDRQHQADLEERKASLARQAAQEQRDAEYVQAERMLRLQAEIEDRRAGDQRQFDLERERVTAEAKGRPAADATAAIAEVQATVQELAQRLEQMAQALARVEAFQRAPKKGHRGKDGRIAEVEVEGFGRMPVQRGPDGVRLGALQ